LLSFSFPFVPTPILVHSEIPVISRPSHTWCSCVSCCPLHVSCISFHDTKILAPVLDVELTNNETRVLEKRKGMFINVSGKMRIIMNCHLQSCSPTPKWGRQNFNAKSLALGFWVVHGKSGL
jgi:hypothetical protein